MAMTTKTINSDSGFTLPEAVLSVMILGISLGACLLSFTQGMRGVNTASNQMTSLHYARNQLEGLRTNSFSSSALTAGTYSISNANYTGNYVVTNLDIWTKNITVNIAYRNRLRGGYTTNSLVTSITTTLHP